jgi:hypothetical protein
MNDRAKFAQYDCEVVVKMTIVINDDEIAETEVTLLSDSNGNFNTDDAIEWLGKAERHYIPTSVDAFYSEYLESSIEW